MYRYHGHSDGSIALLFLAGYVSSCFLGRYNTSFYYLKLFQQCKHACVKQQAVMTINFLFRQLERASCRQIWEAQNGSGGTFSLFDFPFVDPTLLSLSLSKVFCVICALNCFLKVTRIFLLLSSAARSSPASTFSSLDASSAVSQPRVSIRFLR